MSDIDDMIDSIQKQLQKNGLDEIISEAKKAGTETKKIQDFVAGAFLQDFRYDNVNPVVTSLRGAQYELDNMGKEIGQPEGVINEAVYRIRNA